MCFTHDNCVGPKSHLIIFALTISVPPDMLLDIKEIT